MPKIVNTSIKAKAKAWTFEAKAIKFGLEAPRGQGLASMTTSLPLFHSDKCWWRQLIFLWLQTGDLTGCLSLSWLYVSWQNLAVYLGGSLIIVFSCE